MSAIFAILMFLETGVLASSFDVGKFQEQLKQGTQGWVHANVEKWGYTVFTHRDPSDFFTHFEFPLRGSSSSAKEAIKKLTRHDRIKIIGEYIENEAPIPHILVDKLEMIEKFTHSIEAPPYDYEAQLPADLIGQNKLIGKVHAVVADGKAMVIEYKDAVIPVLVNEPTQSNQLYRNDKISLTYKILDFPIRPLHLKLMGDLQILESMVSLHGLGRVLEGSLTLFPKSPQVAFNVFALHVVDGHSISREFTIVNFDNPSIFEAIRDTLQKLWDENKSTLIAGRNKFINPRVRLRVLGTINVIHPSQANPQILVDKLSDIQGIEIEK